MISSGVHPHYVSVAKTMAKFTEDRLETALPELSAETDAERLIASIDDETSAVVVQYPDILGRITDLTPIAEAAHAAGALLIVVVTEPVALGLIKSPGEMGADIVVGEGQSIDPLQHQPETEGTLQFDNHRRLPAAHADHVAASHLAFYAVTLAFEQRLHRRIEIAL